MPIAIALSSTERLHRWLGGRWSLLFSHPEDFASHGFEADRWVVSVNPEDHLLESVTVTGPSDLIEQIRSGRLTIFATVVLTLDDRDAKITQKDATFSDLPTPLTFEVPDTTVRLSIRTIEAPVTP